MRQLVLIVVLSLATAASAAAQVAPIVRYDVTFYNVGAPQPLQAASQIPFSNFVCNQTLVPAVAPVINPRVLEFDDPANVGKGCIYTDPGTASGVLFSMPVQTGPIEATVNAITSTNIASGESARSNSFTHPGTAPAVRTGFKAAQ